ncbi:hypothetical protein GQ53DRAFT_694924 [Thozetella sp. PMI_491]|nr:hypothetical protein GQ53DRAFT_694924 [Thozetella sp. PMI_491]
MFITLKSGPAGKQSAMEPVSTRTARPPRADQERARRGGREACITCQQKKLRCTGPDLDCDRCRMRGLACIFPTPRTRSQPKHREENAFRTSTAPSKPTAPNLEPRNVVSEQSSGDDFLKADLFEFPTTILATELLEPHEVKFGDISDGLNSTTSMPSLSHSGSPGSTPDVPILSSSEEQDSFQIPESFFSGCSSHNNSVSSGLETLFGWAGDSSSACSCRTNALRVVQQFDEDHFGVTGMALDQVLQLQKRLILMCRATLDCANCALSGDVHSLLMIICDNLTEIFECIHKRIRLWSQQTASQQPPGARTRNSNAMAPGMNTVADSSLAAAEELSATLFCKTYGGPATSFTGCSLDLFLPEFQAMYTEQEQIHLIKALMGVQFDTFRDLLDYAKDSTQLGSSVARRSKIESRKVRLAKARENIDGVFATALQLFA